MFWKTRGGFEKAEHLEHPLVLKRLQTIERVMAAQGSNMEENKGCSYLALGRYIIRESYLSDFVKSYAMSSQCKAPWLQSSGRGLKDILIRLGLKAVVLTGVGIGRLRRQLSPNVSCPDVILIKRNVRAFYIKGQLTAKLSRKEGSGSVANEIDFRKSVVAPQKFFPVPEIAAHADDKSWYLEELVYGRIASVRDRAVLTRELMPRLAEHYAYNRQDPVSLAETRLGSRLKALRYAETAAQIDNWLEREVVVSQCHGDLELHNIFMVNGSEPMPVDWDAAGVGSVVEDVASISQQWPEWRVYWDDWVRDHSMTDNPLLVEDIAAIRRMCRAIS